ncbi:GapA-binding peptide SR1P [Gracilibacillus suaedae]|nr:GapA-binding peptide SR1P [Gracilibacillus suaedae]
MGTVICTNCGITIDTLPTQKVTTYYSICQHPHCRKKGHKHNSNYNFM